MPQCRNTADRLAEQAISALPALRLSAPAKVVALTESSPGIRRANPARKEDRHGSAL
jgi:hypothetical protein